MILDLRKEMEKKNGDERGIKKVMMSVKWNKFMRHAFLEAWPTFLKVSRML